VRWYVDHDALARGEPGLVHSFIGSLATAIDCAGFVVDPVQLMGSSGFAFRLWVEDRLLPNAMNAFDWQTELTSAVHRAGFDCAYFESSLNGDPEDDTARRRAHDAVRRSIDSGTPAIAWDLNDPPMWGLIVGYNDHTRIYDTMSSWNYRIPLGYDRLGRRDVKRLSVLVLGEAWDPDESEVLRQILRAAVDHARGREGNPYRCCTSGLAAYDRWVAALTPGTLADHELQFADYYAETFLSFRCYARDYLLRQAHDRRLQDAGYAYGRVAAHLDTSLHLLVTHKQHPGRILEQAASCVEGAAAEERRAIEFLEAYLAHPNSGAASQRPDKTQVVDIPASE